ncbi:hypothetical protein D3C78_732460 [compost metagenome]
MPISSNTMTNGLSTSPACSRGSNVARTKIVPTKNSAKRTTVVRIALGTLVCGSCASPAAIPISSVPENAKDTARRVMAMGKNPVGNSPSRVKLESPAPCKLCTCKRPKMAAPPIAMNVITVRTLINESQNSVSANNRTETTLLKKTARANSALQIQTGVSGNHRTISMPAAVNSEPIATAHVSQ